VLFHLYIQTVDQVLATRGPSVLNIIAPAPIQTAAMPSSTMTANEPQSPLEKLSPDAQSMLNLVRRHHQRHANNAML
jgi:hypothetical protein